MKNAKPCCGSRGPGARPSGSAGPRRRRCFAPTPRTSLPWPCTVRSDPRSGPESPRSQDAEASVAGANQRHRPALRKEPSGRMKHGRPATPRGVPLADRRGDERRLLQPPARAATSLGRHEGGPALPRRGDARRHCSQRPEDDRYCLRRPKNSGTWPHRAKDLGPPSAIPQTAAVGESCSHRVCETTR
jgi:hypothetical protein